MFLQTIQTALLVGAVSARIIDLRIETSDNGVVSHGDDYSSTASCYWSGTSPFCAGSCDSGYSDCATSGCGDGACCVTGYKKYCCRGGCPNLSNQLFANHVSEPPAAPKEELKPKTVQKTDVDAEASCYWSGTSPFCAGSCDSGYSDCATSSCGDGACCVTGYKKYCCRGGCSNIVHGLGPLKLSTDSGAHEKDGDNDDLCKDDEFICCPPAASRNKECKCIKKKKAPEEIFGIRKQKVMSDNDDGQLCKDKQTLCCNPGAETNDECACIDEAAETSGHGWDLSQWIDL